MDTSKFTDKLKGGVSVQQLEDFARKHTPEVFSTLAILIGAISSIFDFFTGPGLTILVLSLAAIAAIAFPAAIEIKLKKIYTWSVGKDKTTEMILGVVKIVIAIFIPFVYFGFLGLLAGTSYHYYVRHAQVVEKNAPATTKESSRRKKSDHD